MLTLREPIKLNISDSLCTMTDTFYERITGAYGVMQADITPKELLFCLSTPYELPDEIGGMTTVAVTNRYTDRRSVTMEMITNVINRILLSTTPQFTYQDQVYIDTVLYKLGVSDVPLFMKQVQKLSDEHRSVEQLLALYREELKQRETQSEAAELSSPAQPAPSPAVEAPSERPRYFLQNEIYDRLQTRELYRLVNRFQTDQLHMISAFHRNELKTAEQLSVSRLLELSELRERVTELPHMELHHTVNRFELGDLLPEPRTSEQVLSQAAEAALLASFEHVFTQCLANRIERAAYWLRLEHALSETIESSVNRFQSFHSEKSFFFTDSLRGPEGLEHFAEESRILRELVKSRTELGSVLELTRHMHESALPEPVEMRYPPIEAQGELVDERETEHTQTQHETHTERDIAALTREVLEHGAAAAIPAGQPPQPSPPPVERSFRTVREIELQNEVRQHMERLRETLIRQTVEKPAAEESIPVGSVDGQPLSTMLRELREHSENTAMQTRSQETLRETTMQTRSVQPAEPEETEVPVRETELQKEVRQRTDRLHETLIRQTAEKPSSEEEPPARPVDGQPLSTMLRELREHSESSATQTRSQETLRETTMQTPPVQPTEPEEAKLPGVTPPAPPAEERPPHGAVDGQPLSSMLRELREHSESSVIQARLQETLRETTMQTPPVYPTEPEEAKLPGATPTAPPAERAKPLSGTPEGPELPLQTLERELREVDTRNREHFEALQVEHLHTKETQTPQPDREKTIEISKRALEAPEKFLRELREKTVAVEKTAVLSEDAKLRLRHADPVTRSLLEAAMHMSSGEPAAGVSRTLREGTPGELNAAALEAIRAAGAAPEMPFTEVEKTLAAERTQTILERIAEPAVQTVVSQYLPEPPKKLSLVHKREQELVTDELIERLENRRSSRTEAMQTIETQTDRRIEEFTRTGSTTKLTAETAQDVTELVNRTLARQMNEISDKVYRQMEKRLQTERSRRGRY